MPRRIDRSPTVIDQSATDQAPQVGGPTHAFEAKHVYVDGCATIAQVLAVGAIDALMVPIRLVQLG